MEPLLQNRNIHDCGPCARGADFHLEQYCRYASSHGGAQPNFGRAVNKEVNL